MKLNSKQRAFLKKKAHNLDPIVRIGKEGLNSNVLDSISKAISKRELIKVKILNNSELDRSLKDFGYEISLKTESTFVDVIGKTFIFFKEKEEKGEITQELKKL